MKKIIITTLALIFSTSVSFCQVACPEQSLHRASRIEWEIPSPLKDRPELIIKHTGYTVSYNTTHGTPNWSAWMLTSTMVRNGTLKRSDVFLADPQVPLAYRVQPTDYQGSGYDRGHMCPAADMSWSKESKHDCFYMSNMCPQTPKLNRISWKTLESMCRHWVHTEDTLYVVCGPVYSKVHKPLTIHHKPSIDVPDGFYKVVLSLRKGHAKAIGFYYTNTSNKQSTSSTTKSVDDIERLTGIDFFCTLPDTIESVVEIKYNLKDWK